MSSNQHRSGLERAASIKAFQEMSDELGRRGTTGELCLFGGAVMVLAFAARISTKDVDAVFQPTHPMREIVRHVGETYDFPEHWLNDAAKSIASARPETVMGNLPQFPHWRLTMPTPEYLLAMKCMASPSSAVEGETDDVADIVFLIRHLKLTDAKAVMDIVAAEEDAYLAATAEWLAWKFDLPPPGWAFEPARSLRRPWFASQLASLRAVLLLESPAPFRSRNLFVSENALSRA
jgi:hypothetical protein